MRHPSISFLRRLMAALFVVALAGCATDPVRFVAAVPVPADRLAQGYAAYATPGPGLGRVLVVRDSGLQGAIVPAQLGINGTPVAVLRSSERLELFVPPGRHVFSVQAAPLLGTSIREVAIDVVAGRSLAYRITVAGQGAPLELQASALVD